MPNLTIGDLRKLLADSNARWRIDPRLNDSQILSAHATGAVVDKLKKARDIGPIDLKAIIQVLPANPMLLQHRIARGFVSPEVAKKLTITLPKLPPDAGVRPALVDWRNRWGWNYITTIQDQDPC